MLSAIEKRRAVRKYTDEPVKTADVNELINAFQAAPCGMHQTDVMQAIVVTDPELRSAIEQASNNACYRAPLLFIIATKQDSNFGERDASAAAENIMLEATDLGYGSVYIMGGALALNKQPALLKKIGVPDGFNVTVIVPVGQTAEQPDLADRANRYQVTRK